MANRTPPPGSPCTNCGRCCTRLGESITATGDDVKRWRREGRDDILRFAAILGPPADPYADFNVDPVLGERERCHFVRKVRGSKRYLCTIYETRPQVCRDYAPWAPGTICETVDR